MSILCLFWNSEYNIFSSFQFIDYLLSEFKHRSYKICGCDGHTRDDLLQHLVKDGSFPTQPTEPRTAISIDLLQFLMKLSERSGDAVTAVSSTLYDFYKSRGYHMLHQDVRFLLISNWLGHKELVLLRDAL